MECDQVKGQDGKFKEYTKDGSSMRNGNAYSILKKERNKQTFILILQNAIGS